MKCDYCHKEKECSTRVICNTCLMLDIDKCVINDGLKHKIKELEEKLTVISKKEIDVAHLTNLIIDLTEHIKNKKQYRCSKANRRVTKQLRQTIKKRDKFTCSNCGKIDKQVEVHHILPISKGGTNEDTNLVCLCSDCHRLLRTDIFYQRTLEVKP